jgi:lipoprotein-anchoring transpeptidase ErfK/SrfK
MQFKHVRNQPLQMNYVSKGTEDISVITSEIISTQPISKPRTFTYTKSKFELEHQGVLYPIASANTLQIGEYIVLEKWENPYFKSMSRFYYPGQNNPLGEYLIILGDKQGKKRNEGIHQWLKWDVDVREFQQGYFANGGCLRTNVTDMPRIFKHMQLGDKLLVLD